MKGKHEDDDDDNVTLSGEIEEMIGNGGGGGGEAKEEEIHDGGADNVTVAAEKEDEELINVRITQEKQLINDDANRNDLSDKEEEEEEINPINVLQNQQDVQVSTLSATNQNPNGCGGEREKSNANSEVEATEVKAEVANDNDNVGAANDEDVFEKLEEDTPAEKEERETKPHGSYLKANEDDDDDEIEELEEEKEEESEGSESESDKEELLKLKESSSTSSLQKQHHMDLVATEEQPQFLNEEGGGSESGNEYEQAAFMKELERFSNEHHLDFKPPKFYGEGLNLLKLYRAVIKLGGYDQVTTCKLWRQVGESFNPPKTCTTVSWTFRIFYEKALLEYEKHKIHAGELHFPDSSLADPKSACNTRIGTQALGSGRARRGAASRAMQGWHSQRLGNDEDKTSMSTPKRESQLRAGLLKRKKPADMDHYVKSARTSFKAIKQRGSSPQRTDTTPTVIDIGHPADWVKVNVRRTRDCFEVYALVPGLLREEVRVQSDPSGRVVISGQPEEPDNPWGVTAFKKVITLPSRIDPHQTSAIVTLHGQLFVRVPFEQLDS
ncbi:hypothetical protein MKX01_020210 [Papaver californicum]|nr:hypothetical protein MKX01_020210 [Papaver californicum]